MVTLVAGLFAIAPSQALAKSYEITSVDINATVSADGTLTVQETRAFDFDGHFNGVYWEIPCGYNSSNGKNVQINVSGVTVDGSQALTESSSGQNNTYSVSKDGSNIRLKVYSAHEDEKGTFTINYQATGIVTRWSDTSELYWKFVSDGWDVESQNVTCTLTLPVASGETVVGGDNVKAWGHGPLDGNVSFDGSGAIVFNSPGVGTEEYAELRVAFPASWLSGLEETSGSRLSTITSEEQQWADEANAKRNRARLIIVGFLTVGVAVSALSIMSLVKTKKRYEREHTPVFQDKYFRDVPTGDHPAVLGALYNGVEPNSHGFTATLMHLSDAGVIRLDKVTTRSKGMFGKTKEKQDFMLTKVGSLQKAKACQDLPEDQRKIDSRANTLLFGKVAPKRENEDEKPSVVFSRIEKYAKEEPEDYAEAYEKWEDAVRSSCLTRFYGSKASTGKGKLMGLGVLNFVVASLAVALAFWFGALDSGPLLLIFLVPALLFGTGIALVVTATGLVDINQTGVETLAQLKALRAWLLEFTHLNEAVPTDVVLWNRLLIMAVALDVADEVVKQLKVVAPELLEDDYLAPTYGWYYGGWGPHSPMHAFNDSFQAAHDVSVAKLASSSDSSGGGGGGGFSSGGGGGFGGGGGGGAF